MFEKVIKCHQHIKCRGGNKRLLAVLPSRLQRDFFVRGCCMKNCSVFVVQNIFVVNLFTRVNHVQNWTFSHRTTYMQTRLFSLARQHTSLRVRDFAAAPISLYLTAIGHPDVINGTRGRCDQQRTSTAAATLLCNDGSWLKQGRMLRLSVLWPAAAACHVRSSANILLCRFFEFDSQHQNTWWECILSAFISKLQFG